MLTDVTVKMGRRSIAVIPKPEELPVDKRFTLKLRKIAWCNDCRGNMAYLCTGFSVLFLSLVTVSPWLNRNVSSQKLHNELYDSYKGKRGIKL